MVLAGSLLCLLSLSGAATLAAPPTSATPDHGPTGLLTGRVLDQQGRPLKSYILTIRPRRAPAVPAVVKTLASRDGGFRLPLAEGAYLVEIKAPGRALRGFPRVTVVPGRTTHMGEVRLAAEGSIRGAVVDSQGQGVRGAAVGIRTASGAHKKSVTGPDGAFVAEAPSTPGPVVLTVSHRAFAPTCVEVGGEDARAPVTLVLTDGGRLEVRAPEQTGGASVRVLLPSSSSCPATLSERPIADGFLALDHLTPGPAVVALLSRERSVLQHREVEVREGETESVEFESRGILVLGRATRSGEPLAGVSVMLLGAHAGAAGPLTQEAGEEGPRRFVGLTSEDGTYQLLVDMPGEYQVRAEGPARSGYPLRAVSIPDVGSFSLDLDFPGITLTGAVTDGTTGGPVPNAIVFVASKRPGSGYTADTRTGGEGQFQLPLDPGEYRVSVLATGYVREELEVVVPGSGALDLEVALSRGSTLAGQVLDAGGAGVPRVPVMARAADPRRGGAKTLTYTRDDGGFRFEGLPGDEYQLFAGPSPAGFAVRARTAAGTRDVVLRLRPSGRARLEVRNARGDPAPGAVVALSRVGNMPLSGPGPGVFVTTDSEGVAELFVPSGEVELEVAAREGRATVTVEASEGQVSFAQVSLTPAVESAGETP